MLELYMEQACLDRVETPVVALDVVVVLLGLSMVANHPDPRRDAGVIGRYGTGFATGAEIFPWIEAERCRTPHRTRCQPALLLTGKVLRAVRLAGVFDNR